MNLEQTGMIMDILNTAYPQFYKQQTSDEKLQAAKLWAVLFANDDTATVAAAVQALIVSDEKGYPPHIGAVKARIRQITQPQEMTELEAWALVSQAVSRTQWQHPERQFDKLPLLIRQTVGTANTLVEWGRVDEQTFSTVTQSNFMRSYRAKSQSDREYNMLPDGVKALVGSAAKAIEAHDD